MWSLRVVVVALAALMALAIDGTIDGRASAAGPVATVAWGLVVAVLVLALVVPSPLGLTLVRMFLPVTVPVAVATLALGAGAAWGIAALAAALLANFVAFSAEIAEAFVQASAYGQERRLPLRAPAALLLPMGLSWVLWCAITINAMLMLSAAQWFVGALIAVIAGVLGWLLVRRFHPFSQRWLVLVPAGVVLHDPVVLGDTLMVQRGNLALARLAPADTQAADLTGPAVGHAVELIMRDMELVVLAGTAAEPKGKALHVQSMLVAPSRPGRALQALAEAKVPVG